MVGSDEQRSSECKRDSLVEYLLRAVPSMGLDTALGYAKEIVEAEERGEHGRFIEIVQQSISE